MSSEMTPDDARKCKQCYIAPKTSTTSFRRATSVGSACGCDALSVICITCTSTTMLREPPSGTVATFAASPAGGGASLSAATVTYTERAWLVVDAAYEHFVFEGPPCGSLAAGDAVDGVVSIHTFSKSYGLAGWRVGHLHYPQLLHEPMV